MLCKKFINTFTCKFQLLNLICKLCFFLGLFPFTKRKCKNNLNPSTQSSTNYVKSYVGLIFSLLLLLVNLYFIYNTYIHSKEYLKENNNTCFKKNFCLTFIEIILQNVQPIFLLLFSTFYQLDRKISLLNGIYKYHNHRIFYNKNQNMIFILFICLLLHLISNYDYIDINIALRYYVILGCVLANFAVLCISCIISDIFYEINNEIENNGINIDLQSLVNRLWIVGDLCNQLSISYGPNLLLSWPYNVVHIIAVLMNAADYIKPESTDSVLYLIQQIVHTCNFLFIFIYIAKVSSNLTQQAERTKACLQMLQFSHRDHYTVETEKLIKILELKLNVRKIEINANGYVTINMQLIQSLLGLIITYWIVLIQFRN